MQQGATPNGANTPGYQSPGGHFRDGLDRALSLNLADTALRLAWGAGAGYADIRFGRNESESLYAREEKLQAANYEIDAGFGIRVLVNGSWGFAGSSTVTEREIERMVARAIQNAAANALIQAQPIVIEELPAYRDDWVMTPAADPFAIATDVKAAHLLAINEAAMKNGADFCSSIFYFVRE